MAGGLDGERRPGRRRGRRRAASRPRSPTEQDAGAGDPPAGVHGEGEEERPPAGAAPRGAGACGPPPRDRSRPGGRPPPRRGARPPGSNGRRARLQTPPGGEGGQRGAAGALQRARQEAPPLVGLQGGQAVDDAERQLDAQQNTPPPAPPRGPRRRAGRRPAGPWRRARGWRSPPPAGGTPPPRRRPPGSPAATPASARLAAAPAPAGRRRGPTAPPAVGSREAQRSRGDRERFMKEVVESLGDGTAGWGRAPGLPLSGGRRRHLARARSGRYHYYSLVHCLRSVLSQEGETMRKTAILLVFLALLVPLSAFAIPAAGTDDKPAGVVSAGSPASPLTTVEPAFDVESLFQVSSKVGSAPSAVWLVRGVCSISCTPCVGSCARGDGICTFACN